MTDSLLQQYEDAVIAAEAYRENEPPPEPGAPTLDKPTVETLTESNVLLNTSLETLNATIREAYELDRGGESLVYKADDPGTATYSYSADTGVQSGYTTAKRLSPIAALSQHIADLTISLQDTMLKLSEAMLVRNTQEALDRFENTINITIQGNASPETVLLLSSEVEKVLVKSIRRGRGGVEVVRKIK